jgi:hypothetical protein
MKNIRTSLTALLLIAFLLLMPASASVSAAAENGKEGGRTF